MHVRQRLGASERHACHVLGQPRSTQRRVKKVRVDESALRTDVIRLASRFGRYGYRQITNLLRIEGWEVNHKRVERIWRQEGLKVPRRQPKRGRLWLNDGSCIRLRPLHKNHVWSYDFVSTRTHDGRALKLLTVLDEYTRRCLAIRVGRRTFDPIDVLRQRSQPISSLGTVRLEHLRSDNGADEFTAKLVRRWLARLRVQTLYIAPGSPWENGYNESFNGKLRNAVLVEGLDPMMYSRFSPISSLGTVRPSIYARTTGRSSRRSWCAGGWPGCGSRPSTSRRAVHGRTATTRASTAS